MRSQGQLCSKLKTHGRDKTILLPAVVQQRLLLCNNVCRCATQYRVNLLFQETETSGDNEETEVKAPKKSGAGAQRGKKRAEGGKENSRPAQAQTAAATGEARKRPLAEVKDTALPGKKTKAAVPGGCRFGC